MLQAVRTFATLLESISRGLKRVVDPRPLHPFGCTPLKEVSNVRLPRGLCGRPLDSFAVPLQETGFIRWFRRGLSDRPLHPFGCTPLKEVSNVRLPRGLSDRSATSIVASYACSFRLRRFASPLEKQSRLWRPVNSNQRFEYDRLVRGCFMRHWRIAAHLPLHPFGHSFGSRLSLNARINFFSCNSHNLSKGCTRRGQGGDRKAPLNLL